MAPRSPGRLDLSPEKEQEKKEKRKREKRRRKKKPNKKKENKKKKGTTRKEEAKAKTKDVGRRKLRNPPEFFMLLRGEAGMQSESSFSGSVLSWLVLRRRLLRVRVGVRTLHGGMVGAWVDIWVGEWGGGW